MCHEEGWNTKAAMDLLDITQYTSKVSAHLSLQPSLNFRKFALTIMARCGFGHESPWKAGVSTADTLSYGDALLSAFAWFQNNLKMPFAQQLYQETASLH